LVGFGFAAHGVAKLSRGPEHFGLVLAAMGMPAPTWAAWVTTLLELAGGVSLMAGAFVVEWSLPLAVVMLVAMFWVHLPYGFSSIKLRAISASGAEFGAPGYELNLLYLVGLATFALGGSGPASFDALRRRKAHVEARSERNDSHASNRGSPAA
jgi:putative oxidoreductase